jgi:hypothetical protein
MSFCSQFVIVCGWNTGKPTSDHQKNTGRYVYMTCKPKR